MRRQQREVQQAARIIIAGQARVQIHVIDNSALFVLHMDNDTDTKCVCVCVCAYLCLYLCGCGSTKRREWWNEADKGCERAQRVSKSVPNTTRVVHVAFPETAPRLDMNNNIK